MEQHGSIENLSAMVPVYGNMENLCLLCANAQNPEGQPFIDIHGQLGTQLKILDKIHKFLAITIEVGFPLQVCASCVGMLNVCHKFVLYSEKAHEKLKSLQKEWEQAEQMVEHVVIVNIETVNQPLNDDSSQADFGAPSPVEIDFMERADDFKKQTPSKKKRKELTVRENQSEEFPMLQKPFHVVKGSQVAIFFAEEDALVKFQFRLRLLLIKKNEDDTNSKESITEKVSRIMGHIKKSIPIKHDEKETSTSSSSTSTVLLHSCQSCKCSFFAQEEMLSHFESLHPEEVHQCTACDEKICGPVQMQEKHMELHRALEEGQTDELLSTLQVSCVNTNMFDPEFVVIELGIIPSYLTRQLSEMLQCSFIKIIQRNMWIKADMKDKLSDSVHILTTNIRRYKHSKCYGKKVWRPSPKVECDVCGKRMQKKCIANHMLGLHNPEKMKCPHCTHFYMISDENSHIESQHNGGKILICKICDSKFSESGEDQPHMIPVSDFPFKCSQKNCRKVYQCEENFKNHRETAHQPRLPKSEKLPSLCDLCGKVYSDKSNLKQHLKSVHFPSNNATVYPCDSCDAVYTTKRYLKRHKISAHGPKFPCEVCGKMMSPLALPIHMRIHDDNYKIPCKYCEKLFNTKQLCEMHELSIHEGVSIRCKICPDFYFKSLKSMEEHNLKHVLGEEIVFPRYLRPVQCSICLESFSNSIKLGHHMRQHKRTVVPSRKRKAGQRNTKKNNDGPSPEKKRKFKVRKVTVPFVVHASFDA